MASNTTTNYGLSQWSLTDGIIMEDFNDDNRKIDAALKAIADSVPHIEAGTYRGTGDFGAASPNTLSFSFVPKLVIVRANDFSMRDSFGTDLFIWVKGAAEDSMDAHGTTRHFTLKNKTLKWYVSGTYASSAWQMNNPTTYYYVALG